MDAKASLQLAINLVVRRWPHAFVACLATFVIRRNLRARRVEIKRHIDAGTIGRSGILRGAALPLHCDRFASIGSAGDPTWTLDDRILRPEIGMRLFVIGLALLAFACTALPGIRPAGWNQSLERLPDFGNHFALFILAAAISGIVYIFGFEVRYNRDKLIATRMFLSRREFRRKGLRCVGDNGAHELVLTFAGTGKARVVKHSRGIADFAAFAQNQLRRNT